MADPPPGGRPSFTEYVSAPMPPKRLALLTKRFQGASIADNPLKATIKIADLPSYVSEKLELFDADGDGNISIDEILQAGAEVEHLRYKARH